MNIILSILILGAIILIHELGHFLMAKVCGIGVVEFSLGMGPRLFSVEMLQSWRFIQTAPADADVRCVDMPDDILGDCMSYVIAHEVGHTLSLMHNMSASAAIPVDSLRSPSFTQKYGTTYSIMDYARYNYVAQPGDKERGVKLTPPDLGAYDYYAIKWLYTPILDAKTY